MQKRVKFLSLVMILAFLSLVFRLFYWQILKGKDLAQSARAQYEKSQTITAPRGSLLASDGSILAARENAYLLFAYLPLVEDDYSEIADKLAPILVEDVDNKDLLLQEANEIKSLLSRENVSWVPIKHKISSQIKSNIEALSIGGLDFEIEEMRVYPEVSSAAHLLGFVGKNDVGENQGYLGLEGYYNLVLSGKPGYLTLEKDAGGTPILIGDIREVVAVGGVDLKTNIDKAVQLAAEGKLKEGIEMYGAKAGSVIVMDPKTGGILAEASFPNYDPEKYYEFSDELFKDPVVANSFEPGSILKVVVMASALDAGIVEPDTKCDVCGGPLRVDKYTIETWNQEYRKDSNMQDVIVYSDNVGMAFVAQQMGSDLLYDYFEKFGLGQLTGIDLQGEATPKLREKGTWNIVDLSTAGFGQGVAVTPIQMITAVSAIANDGIITSPRVVKSIVGEDWEEDINGSYRKRVVSKKTTEQIKAMMIEAAKKGEAKWTHLKGFKIAGKTGTAQIPISGHYDKEKTIASFVGFAPADDPKFLMLVTLREPTSSPWASETAAPLWYSIARDLFLYFRVQPEN